MGSIIALVLTILYYITIAIISIKVLLENRKPIYSVALITMLILLPIVGLILFFFLAYKMNKSTFVSKKWHSERQEIQTWKVKTYSKITKSLDEKSKSILEKWNKIIDMLFRFDKASLTYKNDVDILINGEEAFPKIIKDLNTAKHHINIEFYIFENDEVGSEILNVLFKKAKEGVKIRFIIDSFGSRRLNKSMFKLLRNNNIEVFSFLPLFTPKLFRFVNIRDHRKLITIDGEIAYTGGMNIAKRYCNKPEMKNTKYWRDTQIRIRGDAVKSYELQFFNIWKFVSKQSGDFLEEIFNGNYIAKNQITTQLVDSGPDSEYQSIFNALFIAITNAEKQILIETPYFAPPDEICTALRTAALSGVKIKIIIPKICDNKMVNLATLSYLETFAELGIEFYFYKKGFIHSKFMIFDESLSTIGSTNLDFRSFFANYELNTLFYNTDINNRLQNIFNKDLEECEKLNLEEWKKRHLYKKFLESFCRLFAPIF